MKLTPFVTEVKRPLKNGEYYWVPCIVKEEGGKIKITPVFDHPHNDIENGQPETHYHADYRFIKTTNSGIPINNHSTHIFMHQPRPVKGIHGNLEYIYLPVVNEDYQQRNIGDTTPVELISKTRLKHRCIHKGKCPHRGFDLSQVEPVNGIITCPLHGLQFNAQTKLLTSQTSLQL